MASDIMFPTTDSTDSEWIYRGEGNCNIVIALPRSKQILRIRKTDKPKSILGWILVLISDLLYWYCGKAFNDECRDLTFYSKIMRPLLGYSYTSECKQVILNRKQLQIFKEGLIKERPEFRKNKTLQYSYVRAAIFNDFAFLPKEFDQLQFVGDSFSVEIKPKQAWRPFNERIHPQCFFCMHQYLKLEKKLIQSRSRYCPEELFSGDKQRMNIALKNLMEIPQNNFKIFKNGLLCYDDKHKSLKVLQEMFESDESEETLCQEFCDFLQRCLVKNLENSENEVCNRNCKNSCSTLDSDSTRNTVEYNKLPQGSVLGRILSIQMLDKEGTHSTYKKLTKSDTWDEYSFVDKLLDVLDNDESACVRCTVMEAPKYENELMFLPYLVSAIAKDCSLMITFRKLRESSGHDFAENNVLNTKFGAFLVNIGVFDLYPKPLSTIRKHYIRNRDIFKAFKKRELS